MITIAKKILGAWEGREFKSQLKDTYDCELTDCCIDTKKWLDPLTSDNLEPSVDSLIDLEPLRRQLAEGLLVDPLTNTFNDLFLPPSIFVREEMKGIFKLFCRDVDLLRHTNNLKNEAVPKKNSCVVFPYTKKTILLGSPGVGKSILSFLAALYRAQSTVTIYIRRTLVGGEDNSLFIMFPEDDETDRGKVRVLFTRRLKDQCLTTGLFGLISLLEKRLQLEREEYYLFLDGPRFNPANLSDTLHGQFDFLCTSAGYPPPRGEEYGNSRYWFLSGWTKEDAETAFVQMHSDTDEVKRKAQEAYALCGGKIRDMCHAFENHEEVRNILIQQVKGLNKDHVKFCLYSSSTSDMNKIRIVFRDDLKNFSRPLMTQYVDSKFPWKVLSQKLGTEQFVNEYKYDVEMVRSAMAGWHFESTVHAWFSELIVGQQDSNPIIRTVLNIAATSDKKDDQLIKERNQYWIPPSTNFRNVDSAVVIGDTLYAFQVTVCKNHKFDASTFFDDFLGTVKAFNITCVRVCVLSTQRDFAIRQYEKQVTGTVHLDLLSSDDMKCLVNISRSCWLQFVDMQNVESFRQSMNGLVKEIRKIDTQKRKASDVAIPGVSSKRLLRSKQDYK